MIFVIVVDFMCQLHIILLQFTSVYIKLIVERI